MANTYTQLHVQVVFAVQNRLSLISKRWKQQLYLYITSIIQDKGHKVLAIGGPANHIHILIGLRPTEALSTLVHDVKISSSHWINSKRLVFGKFAWQEGYSAFSYSKSEIPRVCNYINNQEEHHRVKTFLEEYEEWLSENEIEYDRKYIFKDVDSNS